MPEQTPPSVRIAQLIVGALVALALIGSALAGLLTGKLGGEPFVALVTLAAAGAGVGAVAASRRKRAPKPSDEGGTTYAGDFDPAKRLTDAQGRELRTKVGSEDKTPPQGRARAGFLRIPRFVQRILVALDSLWWAARAHNVIGERRRRDAGQRPLYDRAQPVPPRTSAVMCLLALGVLLAGCPGWVRPDCTTPGRYECRADQPHYCGTSRALTPIGDVPCSRTGGACVIDADGVASCGGAR